MRWRFWPGSLNWALEEGVELSGLSVTRTTLEDIYLDLTRSNTDEPRDARAVSSARPRTLGARAPGRRRPHRPQVRYEQLSFWVNRIGAAFTVGFSVVFLVLLGASAGNSRISYLGNIKLVDYYVPGFVAYGVMAACFTTLAITLVVRRETGLLKRLRLSPLPTWALLIAIFISTMIVALVQVILLLVIGRFGYGVHLPTSHGRLRGRAAGRDCQLRRHGRGHEHGDPQPGGGRAGDQHRVLRAAVPVRAVVPAQGPLGPGVRSPNYFPVRHFILAVSAPFEFQPGVSPWAWHDLLVVAIWGAAATVVALRRFRWSPRRS